MPFDLSDLQFTGPALPEPFVKFELENELTKLKLLPKNTGNEGKQLKGDWDVYRRELAKLAVRGGYIHVRNQVIRPLCKHLDYDGEEIESAADVETREGREDGGYLLVAKEGAKLRVWTTDFDEDLDAPAQRGQAYRFSHLRIAQRVLLATGERVGLLTNGVELRLLISDPARPDSQVIFTLDPNWKRSREVPDSFRLLLALASPAGVQKIPELVDKARLQQARVTKDLRDQARQAIGRFVQEVLDHPDNRQWLTEQKDRAVLARALWHEGLIIVYRLLFILKLESSDDPARSFTFASTSLWRNTFSPSMALARYAPKVLYDGVETGGLLEQGMRGVFRMFHEGIECTELNVKPLGGACSAPVPRPRCPSCDGASERSPTCLTSFSGLPRRKRAAPASGSTTVRSTWKTWAASMRPCWNWSRASPPSRCAASAARSSKSSCPSPRARNTGRRKRGLAPSPTRCLSPFPTTNRRKRNPKEDESDSPKRGKKTTVQWIEEIRPGKFYLRVGLGRKATGSFYTPHSFVRFLVQETLGPQVAERSPNDDPQPGEILKLKVLDPAMGSGHFLVEACRFLGQHLYEAARLCDEKAIAAERRGEQAKRTEDREAALAEAQKLRQRVIDLPNPDDELLRYLPSRSVEGDQSGVSQRRAEALCRRMVAVHCLYGVDKNPLAVELAKLALWLESHAEGMPLTFLDHRLVVGDSLTGPFWEQMLTWPSKPKEKFKEGYFHHIETHLRSALFDALRHVRRLEATVGVSLAEVNDKAQAKAELDDALLPFRVAAAAWSGGVMLGSKGCDDAAYMALLEHVGTTHELPDVVESDPLRQMIARGLGVSEVPADSRGLHDLVLFGRCTPALSYDLTFPEVFYPNGVPYSRQGFNAVLGNPPWDAIQFKSKEFFAAFDFEILNAPTKRERTAIEKRLTDDPKCGPLFDWYKEDFEQQKRINSCLYQYQKVSVDGDLAGRQLDAFRVFMERNSTLLGQTSITGVVVPSAFHANEGATGVRQLYMQKMSLRCCYSFENHRKLFEIDSRFKFAVVVAAAGGITTEFLCAFYLHDDDWLFMPERTQLRYSLDFVKQTTGDYLTLLEPRSEKDLAIIKVCFANCQCFAAIAAELHMVFGRECDMALDSWRFTPSSQVVAKQQDARDPGVLRDLLRAGILMLHEGKTFRQYDDQWAAAPSYLVRLEQLADKPDWCEASRYYRLGHRRIAGPGDENVSIWAFLPAGCVCGHNAPVERRPSQRRQDTTRKISAHFRIVIARSSSLTFSRSLI